MGDTFFQQLKKLMEVFGMQKFTALVNSITPGTAKNGRNFWKVEVTVGGDTHYLWCWDANILANIRPQMTVEFMVDTNGTFFNIETAVPYVDSNTPAAPFGDEQPDSTGAPTALPPLVINVPAPTPKVSPRFGNTGGDDRKHSIVRQTAWKCACALFSGDGMSEELIAAQRSIEADMLEA